VVAFALKTGTPVVSLRSWGIEGTVEVGSAVEAVATALRLAGSKA
jgi:hypothetical protein